MMKHKDLRHHFIQYYVKKEEVNIQFFHSEANIADPFTKNLSNGPFE